MLKHILLLLGLTSSALILNAQEIKNNGGGNGNNGGFSEPLVVSCLTSNVYALEGRECNIYFQNILRTPIPLSNYRLSVTCNVGTQENDRWTFTPTSSSLSSYAWQLDVFYGPAKVATVKAVIVVSMLNRGAATNIVYQTLQQYPLNKTDLGSISSWGFPLASNLPAFNRMDYSLCWTAAAVTSVRVIIRDTSEAGAILGEAIVAVTGSSPQAISVVFTNVISTTNLLYFQQLANNPCAYVADSGTYMQQGNFFYGTAKDLVAMPSTATTVHFIPQSRFYRTAPRHILFIGDSTLASTVVSAEVTNLFVNTNAPAVGNADPMPIAFVGSFFGTNVDSSGNSRIFKNAAISGWSISSFYSDTISLYTNNGVTFTGSPFITNGSFNFKAFLTNFSIVMNPKDVVFIHLGINDVFAMKDDSALNARIAQNIAELTGMITKIKLAIPGINIGLLVTIPPDETQGGFGTVYNNYQQQWRYKRNRYILAERFIKTFSNGLVYPNVYVFPYHAGLDCVNGYPSTTTSVGFRYPSVTYSKHDNGVHPSNAGYYQLADEIKAYLKSME